MKVVICGIKEFYGLSFFWRIISMDVRSMGDSRKRCQNIFNLLKNSCFQGVNRPGIGKLAYELNAAFSTCFV